MPDFWDDDAAVDAVTEDAQDAAINAWGPLGAPTHRPNPHAPGTPQHDCWWRAFRSAYASNNGY